MSSDATVRYGDTHDVSLNDVLYPLKQCRSKTFKICWRQRRPKKAYHLLYLWSVIQVLGDMRHGVQVVCPLFSILDTQVLCAAG